MSRSFADRLPHYPEVQVDGDNGFIPFVDRDEKGRIVHAYGTITGGRNVKGTGVDPKLSKALREGRPGFDQAGHIIAKCMGGSGRHPDNLFCQNSSVS
uniref:Uncharacterized protein n=1 Tax=Panagrolaimus sp. ES5 TaxID=591445 RepID=A0AC34F8I4_9BILA